MCETLLGNDSLASIASWADDIRNQRDETYNWHFVDIPKSAGAFDEQRDCFRPDDTHAGAQTDHHNCVVDRITLFKQVLADSTASPNDRVEALKFIVHFVGDIHQPFHAVGDAKGANGIHVSEFGSSDCNGRPCNLHSAWDDGLIHHTGLDEQSYVQHLEQVIADQHLQASGNPEDWANESHGFVDAAWVEDGTDLDESYYSTQIKVIDQRLALAGLRLAALLNDVFAQPQGSGTDATTTGTSKEAVLTANVNLRPDPSSTHHPINKLHKDDIVELVSSTLVNGYYLIKTEDGQEGWVFAQYLTIKPQSPHDLELMAATHPAAEISETWDKPEPNKTTFKGPDGTCPWNGNDNDPDTFVRKKSERCTRRHRLSRR